MVGERKKKTSEIVKWKVIYLIWTFTGICYPTHIQSNVYALRSACNIKRREKCDFLNKYTKSFLSTLTTAKSLLNPFFLKHGQQRRLLKKNFFYVLMLLLLGCECAWTSMKSCLGGSKWGSEREQQRVLSFTVFVGHVEKTPLLRTANCHCLAQSVLFSVSDSRSSFVTFSLWIDSNLLSVITGRAIHVWRYVFFSFNSSKKLEINFRCRFLANRNF